ncbi:MAG: DUF4133 domain-containing protein [Prevotella sp.]
MDNTFNGFPVFKGLQKPLEFMGIRGRFLTLAACAIGASFIGFIIFSIILGKLFGFIAMVAIAAAGLLGIFIKQRGGLHNKKRYPGIYFFCRMYER